MDQEHTAPALPALTPTPTKRGDRVVKLGDYLGRFAGYASTMKRRRVLRQTGSNVVSLTTKQPVAHYVDTWKGLTATAGMVLDALPAPATPATPTLPDRKAILIKWVLARAAEPSTWRGLLLCLTSLGVTLAPDAGEALIALGIALAGAVGIFFPDSPAGQ
jgi:hypothetical protein